MVAHGGLAALSGPRRHTQARSAARECPNTQQLGACYPELHFGDPTSHASFGYNWTHPSAPPSRPWEHFTTEELGANVGGIKSAAVKCAAEVEPVHARESWRRVRGATGALSALLTCIDRAPRPRQVPSMRQYDSDGFIALAIPFFSDTYLPRQEGLASEIRNFHDAVVTPTNGRTPRFYCVRVSLNGRHVKQLCDPGADGHGHEPYTGAVRATIEEWWNDLKRGHFLDSQTRSAERGTSTAPRLPSHQSHTAQSRTSTRTLVNGHWSFTSPRSISSGGAQRSGPGRATLAGASPARRSDHAAAAAQEQLPRRALPHLPHV
jgi:hypothetical protein